MDYHRVLREGKTRSCVPLAKETQKSPNILKAKARIQGGAETHPHAHVKSQGSRDLTANTNKTGRASRRRMHER